MALTPNRHICDWVAECEELLQPEKVLWIDGSEAQLEALRQEAYLTGELVKLNQEKLPAWRAAPLSAASARKMPALPTTGWIPPR